MIKEIRKIKIEELQKEYQDQLEDLKLKISEAEKFIKDNNREKLEQEMSSLRELSNKFSIKYFQGKKRRELIRRISETQLLLYKTETVQRAINHYKEELNKINIEINSKKSVIEQSDLFDFNLDFNSACDFLKQHQIEPILTEEDKEIIGKSSSKSIKNASEYQEGIHKLKDYVLVHKTHFYPKNGQIKTDKEIGIEGNIRLNLDKIGSLKFSHQRNTIHFSVNGEVGSHGGGNWDDCEYAILIPFTAMPINQLRCGAVMDTYIENGLTLPNSAIILCPIDKLNEVRTSNSNVRVVGYNGENVMNYANALVGMMGYKTELVGMWSWVNQEDTNSYYQKLEESGLNIHTTPHTYSYECALENSMNGLSVFKSLVDKVIEEKIILSEEEIKQLIKDMKISLLASSQGPIDYLKLQTEMFNELIPFLQKNGIVLNQEKIQEVMNIALSMSENITNEQKQQLRKNFSSSDYRDRFPYEYVNALLMEDIFGQLNEKIQEEKGKSK